MNIPFPLLPPWMARTAMAMGKLVDKPQAMKHTMVARRPVMMVGFRP